MAHNSVALSLFRVERAAHAAMLTAGVEATERYLALPPEERVQHPPEEDPAFKLAQDVLTEATQRLSQAAINAA